MATFNKRNKLHDEVIQLINKQPIYESLELSNTIQNLYKKYILQKHVQQNIS